MKIYSSILVVVFLGLLTSCGSGKSSSNADSVQRSSLLYNKTWHLDKIKGQSVSYDTEDEKWPSLIMEENKGISGFAGCNTFMGNLETGERNELRFSKIASTRMACPDGVFNENTYLNALDEVRSYQISQTTLELMNEKGKTILAYSVMADEENGITEKYWKLKTLEGKEVEMGEDQQKEVHFTLKERDHRVQGFSGCNNFSGKYSLKDDSQITFSQVIGTLKACLNQDFNESAFLKIFGEVDHYRQDGDNLELRNTNNEVLATFEAVYL